MILKIFEKFLQKKERPDLHIKIKSHTFASLLRKTLRGVAQSG
jgi:hypothetical protein